MKSSLSEYLAKLDRSIREGKTADVQRELSGLDPSSLSRDFAAPIAKLARRVNLAELAVNVLHPIVRSQNPLQEKASGTEIAEYAAALTYLGASQEAYGLLKKLDPKKNPESLLFQAFALFARWEYKSAIEPLVQYINTPQLSEYDRLVGKVNLGSALLFERLHAPLEEMLNAVIKEATAGGHRLLLANALEMLAENNILMGRWNIAEKLLFEAEGAVHTRTSLYALFIRKRRVFLTILSEGMSDLVFADLQKIKHEAKEWRHWETVRDCDRFEAIVTKNVRIFFHVYFGTPFRSFRERLLSDFGANTNLPEFYFWGNIPVAESSATPELDLRSGSVTFRSASGLITPLGNPLEPRSQCHRLLVSLCADFYSPQGLRSLYATLFPKEFYDPSSSDDRVRSVAESLNQWFHQGKMPIELQDDSGFFRLCFKAPFSVKIPAPRSATK